ncbi:MAG: ATP-binding protein, partial [Actinomycetes bacterium]
ESELATAEAEVSRRIGVLGDAARVTGFDPTAAALDDTHQLNSQATAVAGAAQQLTTLDDAARTASSAVTVAQQAHEQALERFTPLSGGLGVDDLLRGAGTQAPLPAAPAAAKVAVAAWFAPVAFVLLAVGGFATRSYVLGGAALVLAAIALVFALRSSRAPQTTAASGTPAAPVGPSEAVRDAALRVYDAQTKLDDARTAANQSVTAVDAARSALTSLRAQLAAALEQAGLPAGTDATEVAGLVERWRAAARATEDWRAAKKAVTDAVAARDAAVSEQQTAAAALEAALAPLRIVAGSGPEVANAITALRNDITAAQEARAAQGTLDDLTSRAAALLAPVGLAPQDAASAARTAEQHAETLATRSGLSATISELNGKVQAACAASAVVKDLVDGHPDTEQLKQEQRLVTEQIADLEGQKQHHDDAAADARATKNSLLDTDAVTALEEQVQALDADANDLAVEAVAAALAHLVLREEVATEEQTRRPALVERTSQIATAVAAPWNEVLTLRREDGSPGFDLKVLMDDGQSVPAHQLSTGARMVLYLALRVAVADDRTQGGVALPLLCDDPLVNIDPQRAPEVMKVLAEAAKDRQVVITTCHPRTAELAEQAGGKVVRLGP